jgi:hypothetical protein
MGGVLPVRQGLAIKVLNVDPVQFHSTKKMRSSKKSKKKTKTPQAYGLVRTTETKVVGDVPPDQIAQIIREKGLKIGMRFRKHHQIVSVKYAFGNALPAPAQFKEVSDDISVTNACHAVFSTREQWFGFRILKADIPPLSYPPEEDRVYFIVTVDNFIPNHKLDFDEVPVVAVLNTTAGFKGHYALGMGIFALGKKRQSIEFDTCVIGSM